MPKGVSNNPDLARSTRAQNKGVTIDLSTGSTIDELRDIDGRSLYVKKLHELVRLTEAGDAEVGLLYKIGQYQSPQGAAGVLRALKGRDDLPAVDLLIIPKRVADGSELWAGVAEPELEIPNTDRTAEDATEAADADGYDLDDEGGE
jgi:hypothetical protein